MATPIQGVSPTALPWARKVDERLDKVERVLGILTSGFDGLPAVDKTVYSEFATGQNIALGTSGRVEPTTPVNVRFVSSTGMYEVTVSMAGLVRDGAIMGAGFESQENPYEVTYDMPTYGVTGSAPIGQTAWSPFSASYSTVMSTRAGVQDLALYLYAVCTVGANSAGFIKRVRLSVRAV